ncbi:MAG: hypothetical protein AABO58_06585 [Acidobacteriota bacterium]
MSAQIVFLTLFLGLVSGPQHIVLQVSGPVKTVRIMLDGREVGVMSGPPWRLNIDFGPDLTPRELTAVGFNDQGEEIARARQFLNIPRPTAEFEIALERDGNEPPTGATLRWRHLVNVQPVRAKLTLDGAPLPVDEKLHVKLPKLDIEVPHVLAAELHFGDGFVARRELVIESVLSDSVGTELTPVLLRETTAEHPDSWDGCLTTAGGGPVRIAAVEKPRGLMIMVRNPDPRPTAQAFGMSPRAAAGWSANTLRRAMPLDRETIERIQWPVARRYTKEQETTSILFETSADMTAGVLYLMLLEYRGGLEGAPRRFADAVAVAGVRALTGSQRRAVVVVLSATADASKHDPLAVRRYLQSIGVPLFVWSIIGPRPEVTDAWGEVEDVSSLGKLGNAVNRLRHELDEQRIAWVDVDPLTALQLQAKESCGIATVARPAP